MSYNKTIKKIIFEKQKGICAICPKSIDLDIAEGDHIIPWSQAGKTVESNCQLLCEFCHIEKTSLMKHEKKSVKNRFLL